ncbi:MAG: efflux RND transporter permease subunit, partial [Chlamydiae bacterium]|nr:efflux RND transporter permease subunit [Chlamydiota bacterium]
KKPKTEALSDKVNDWLKKIYAPCLHFAMRHRLLMLSIGTASIVGSFVLYSVVAKDFLPPDDIGFIEGFTQARDGTSPFLMKEYHKEICEIARKDPSIESILSISSYGNSNQGILFCKLKPFSKRPSMYDVIGNLSAKYTQFPGCNVYLSPLPLINLTVGSTAQALYQYSMTSIDQKTLFSYATELTRKMQMNPMFSQVSNDLLNHQPQWSFHILRDKASNYNVSAQAIENFLGWAYSDNKISQINGTIAQYDVIVETLPRFYEDPTVLSKLYIRSTTDDLVPLSELVKPTQNVGLLNVNHFNGFPNVNISFNSAPNVALGAAIDELKNLTSENFPSQINGQVIGTASLFAGSTKSLELLLLLSIFIIYVVLGILYESFVHPITVMSAIPPTLFGGLFALFVFNEPLSLYSFIGLILLIGIVLKNGIIMIDFANDAAKSGKSAYDAIIEACLIRFRPILMTTVSAMMGALPVAFGIGGAMAQNRISLGICVVGGLIVSQLLTLLLTPVLYYYFELLQERMKTFFGRFRNLSK